MGCLVRLFVLALAATAVTARRRRGGRPGPPSLNMTEAIERLQEADCLPADFNAPDLSSCQDQTGDKNAKLQCVVDSLNIAGDSGYDQTAGEAFIDSLSSDEQWTAEQKETLTNCTNMMSPELATDKQGIFMLVCWVKVLMFECGKDRLADAAEAVSPDDGRDVGEAVAYLAAGHCISKGLKNPAAEEAFMSCAGESSLDLAVMMEAGKYFKMAVMGNDVPELSAENIADVGEQLVKFNETVYCTMQATGELNEDGTVNYEQITANIDASNGPDALKTAAKAVSDFCQGLNPETSEEYITCWFMAQPYACTSIKAHMVAMGIRPGGRGGGRRGGRGGGRGGGRRGGRGGRRRGSGRG